MSHGTKPVGTLLAVLAVVAALVVASATGVSAAALTPKSVKKIATKAATKVVTKKASSLSVAHSTTADRATSATTADTAATADRVKALVFTLPSQAAANERNYSFPGLAAGTYLVSYTLIVAIANGSTLLCQLKPDGGRGLAPSFGPGVASSATATGSSIVSVSASFRLSCSGSSPFTVAPDLYTSTVSFVPVATGAPTAAAG